MGKINVNQLDEYAEDYEVYEKFTKSNRKKTRNEEDILQLQGKSGRGRKGDSHITQRTKARN
jgi:hypothetical protein